MSNLEEIGRKACQNIVDKVEGYEFYGIIYECLLEAYQLGTEDGYFKGVDAGYQRAIDDGSYWRMNNLEEPAA